MRKTTNRSVRRRTAARVKRTPEETARLRAVRERFQREKPTLEEVRAANGQTEAMTLGDYLQTQELLRALQQTRKRQNVTLAQLAARTGYDTAVLSRLFTGRQANTTFATVGRIANALGKTLVHALRDLPTGAVTRPKLTKARHWPDEELSTVHRAARQSLGLLLMAFLAPVEYGTKQGTGDAGRSSYFRDSAGTLACVDFPETITAMDTKALDPLDAEVMADNQAIIDHLTSGKPLDAELVARVRQRAERITEEIRCKHGVLDIGVPRPSGIAGRQMKYVLDASAAFKWAKRYWGSRTDGAPIYQCPFAAWPWLWAP